MEGWVEYGEWGGAGRDPAPGRLWVRPRLESPQLGNRRHIAVCVPPGYDDPEETSYPVVYMQDGQNLFDAATSFAGSWEVVRTVEELAGEGLKLIVVGIPNAGRRRLDEYGPFRDRRHGGGLGDAYLRFLVDTVMPEVDRRFRTRPGAASTGLAGSSMGGLISLYGAFARPEVFGLAAALSPALRVGDGSIFNFVSRAARLPARVYLDVGTREAAHVGLTRISSTLNPMGYARQVRRMRDLLVRRGLRPGETLLHVEEKGGVHNEANWGRRLPAALRFLFGPPRGPS